MGRELLGAPVPTSSDGRASSEPNAQRLQAQVEPLVSRGQWDFVQATRLKRRVTRDPDRDFLIGILHDQIGRRMVICSSAPGYGHKPRYYKAENRSLSISREPAVFVDAVNVERLAKSALQAFFVDRVQLKDAVLSLGLYSDQIAGLLKKGRIAARRVGLMEGPHLRRVFLALVPRAEVTKSELRLYISCHELSRFLAWDGTGLFTKAPIQAERGGARRQRVNFAFFPLQPTLRDCYTVETNSARGLV